ncbi:MAG: glycoside hydrolase family 3 protein [bacterium]|nr:glycoside hydrolase family 3 protein [bacterium]
MPTSAKIFIALLIVVIIIAALFYYIRISQNTIVPQDNYASENSSVSENNTPAKDATTPESVPDQEVEVALKDKIGQMIMLGFRGTQATADSPISNTISNLKIGGVILFDYDVPSKSFPRNIVNPDQTKKLIANLQSQSSVPLLISVDAEGGNVNRLKEKYGFLKILSAKEMGKDTTLKTTQRESLKLATELKELGFNMNFAPVVDVDINPQNPIIGALGRSFSPDPKTVTDHARVFLNSHIGRNIIPVEKHFPGHGSSTSDSHLGVVDVTKTYQQKELTPYIQLQKEGLLDVVMTAHIINKNIDKNYPATLSPEFLQKILRQQIGFQGVIISDDMQMNAIVGNYGFKEAIIKSVNAGCDILLLSNNGTAAYDPQLPHKAVDIIYNAVKEGNISQEKIEESYDRIINLKKKFKIVN